MKIIAFVPLKLHSQRMVQKNLARLGKWPLYRYILETLTQVREIDRVYVYSSTSVFKKYSPPGVDYLKRPSRLDASHVKGKEIYQAFCASVDADAYLLAHATSPFLKASTLRRAIRAVKSGKYDSALSVRKKQTFAWFQGKPLNYKRTDVVRTQHLSPVFLETSGFYLFKKTLMLRRGVRVGRRPFFCEVGEREGLDIDTPEDLCLAKAFLITRQRHDS